MYVSAMAGGAEGIRSKEKVGRVKLDHSDEESGWQVTVVQRVLGPITSFDVGRQYAYGFGVQKAPDSDGSPMAECSSAYLLSANV